MLDGVPTMVLLLSMVHVFVAYHLLSIVVDFMLLSIYIGFYFKLASDTYSVRVPCTDPYLYLSFCYLWSAANVPSTLTRPQL